MSSSAHKAANPHAYPVKEKVKDMYPVLKYLKDIRPTQVHLQVYDGEPILSTRRHRNVEIMIKMLLIVYQSYSPSQSQANTAIAPWPHSANALLAC